MTTTPTVSSPIAYGMRLDGQPVFWDPLAAGDILSGKSDVIVGQTGWGKRAPGKSVPPIEVWATTADHDNSLISQPIGWYEVGDPTKMIKDALSVAQMRRRLDRWAKGPNYTDPYLFVFLDHTVVGRAALDHNADRLLDLATIGPDVHVVTLLGHPYDKPGKRLIIGEDLAQVVRAVRVVLSYPAADPPNVTRRQAHAALQVVRAVQPGHYFTCGYAMARIKHLARPSSQRLPSRATRKRIVAAARRLGWDTAAIQTWFLEHRGRDYPIDTIRCVLDHAVKLDLAARPGRKAGR